MEKKSKRILQLTFPRVKPEKSVGDHAVSKSFKGYDMMTFDEQKRSMVLNLVSCTREFVDANQRLREKREAAKREHVNRRVMWKELHAKQLLIKELIEKYNNFVVENENKRERTIKKIGHYTARAKKNAELKDVMQKEHKELMDIKVLLEAKMKKLKIYEDYLWSVVDHRASTVHFVAPIDIIKRYMSLMGARQSVMAQKLSIMNEYDVVKTNLLRMRSEKYLELMTLTMISVRLTARQEAAASRILKFEAIVHTVQNELYKRQIELSNVRDCIWKMYNQVHDRNKQHHTRFSTLQRLPKEDIANQMLAIKKFMSEARVAKILGVAKATDKDSSRDARRRKVPLKGNARKAVLIAPSTSHPLNPTTPASNNVERFYSKHSLSFIHRRASSYWNIDEVIEEQFTAQVTTKPTEIKPVDPLLLDPTYLKKWKGSEIALEEPDNYVHVRVKRKSIRTNLKRLESK